VEEFKDVVECKRSDTVLWKDKETAWDEISKKYLGYRLLTLQNSKKTKQKQSKYSQYS
jgi:hypothetical protein